MMGEHRGMHMPAERHDPVDSSVNGDDGDRTADIRTPTARVSYTSIDETPLELVPWEGEHVAFLTQSDALDPDVMARIVGAVDRAWEFYAGVTGREPAPFEPFTLNGRGTVADVPSTCGAGCGFLGFTGIELQHTWFQFLYDGVANSNTYDQPVFYELGRNFWFYSEQLGAIDPFVTGFAVVNRFLSMDAAGLAGARVNGAIDFQFFREQALQEMGRLYLADPASTWQSTLLDQQVPENPLGLGAADVAGALFYRIHEDMGPGAYAEFFQALDDLPFAATPEAAVQNFVAAAEAATGADYRSLFKEGFELSVGTPDDDVLMVGRPGAGSDVAAFGFQGDDKVLGHRGADHLFGGLGDDELRGRAGDDQLIGATGDDRLFGGPGDDWLAGGAGDDLLSGGAGNDTFVFRPGWGDDTIRGFDSSDTIDLRGFGASSFEELGQVAAIVQGETGGRPFVELEFEHDTLRIVGIDELRAEHVSLEAASLQDSTTDGLAPSCGCGTGPRDWAKNAASFLDGVRDDDSWIGMLHAHAGLMDGFGTSADYIFLAS
jgi:serralysin